MLIAEPDEVAATQRRHSVRSCTCVHTCLQPLPYTCLSVHMNMRVPFRISVHTPIRMPVHMPVRMSAPTSTHMSVHMPTRMPTHIVPGFAERRARRHARRSRGTRGRADRHGPRRRRRATDGTAADVQHPRRACRDLSEHADGERRGPVPI